MGVRPTRSERTMISSTAGLPLRGYYIKITSQYFNQVFQTTLMGEKIRLNLGHEAVLGQLEKIRGRLQALLEPGISWEPQKELIATGTSVAQNHHHEYMCTAAGFSKVLQDIEFALDILAEQELPADVAEQADHLRLLASNSALTEHKNQHSERYTRENMALLKQVTEKAIALLSNVKLT